MKKSKIVITLVSCLVISGGIVSYQMLSPKDESVVLNDSVTVSELANADDANVKESTVESVNGESVQKQELAFDKKVVTHADFVNVYNDLDSLEKEASIVVEGEITDTSVFLHKVNDDVVPYTIYKVEVSKVFSGDVSVGDVINVAEYGGVITAEEAGLDAKFPEMSEDEKEQKIYFSFGNSVSVTGDKLLIFGSDNEGFQILDYDEPYYMLVNEYQGKFDFDAESNSYSRDIPDFVSNIDELKISDDEINSTLSTLE